MELRVPKNSGEIVSAGKCLQSRACPRRYDPHRGPAVVSSGGRPGTLQNFDATIASELGKAQLFEIVKSRS